MPLTMREPFLEDSDVTLYAGDVLDVLREMEAESVDCVVTSPPYWGLRDYGTPGQLGLEPTPEEYVERMVEVFREARRVLASHGTVWLNLGDSYNAYNGNRGETGSTLEGRRQHEVGRPRLPSGAGLSAGGLKQKDLVGVPWRVAFALQADGWYLRSDIIWSKPNPMPESVTDRPTKAHEMVFLLAKGQWKARVVALADLHGEVMHLGNHVGSHDPNVWAHQFSIGLATAILDSAELQEQFTLPPLDAEVWQELYGGGDGKTIRYLPVEHRALMYASAFRATNVSAKEFLCELDRLGISLTDGEHFKVVGGTTEFTLPPTINRYGETSIAIHDSGEIGEVDFTTHTVKCSRPSRCSYFFDQEAVREPYLEPERIASRYREGFRSETTATRYVDHQIDPRTPGARGPDGRRKTTVQGADGSIQHRDGERWPNGGRNIRSVWEIATQPYPEAHFATFPEELARRSIAAGCPEQVCRVCGKARERITRSTYTDTRPGGNGRRDGEGFRETGVRVMASGRRLEKDVTTEGFTDCGHSDYRPGIVLDPFVGSGTTCHVARKLGRRSVGIDLSAEYLALAARRLQQLALDPELLPS